MKIAQNTLTLSVLSIAILITDLRAQQIELPAPSPFARLEQRVGLTDIVITYSRPGVKDRQIFGDLVPYDRLWRTGANMATTISFSDDVKIEGKELAAGTYSLFSIPGRDEWTLIFNTVARIAGTANYDEKNDALRVDVNSHKLNNEVETFLIDLNDVRDDHANLVLAWADTYVKARIDVEVDSKVMDDIRRAMDPAADAGKYYAAARYYYDTDRDLGQALEWINKSIELGNERYWVIHLKANILEKKGECKEAVVAAEKSKELAREAGNPDYVALNEKLIARCNK